MSRPPTYAQLFRLLESLGFREDSRAPMQRAFHHQPSNTLLVFSLMGKAEDSPMASGDLLSARVNLESSGLIKGRLEDQLPQRAPSPGIDSRTPNRE
jgi:hypothetical protein